MSGHGRGEAASERHRITAEVRTVNHRFSPISLRMPSELGPLEDRIRRRVQQAVRRGKVDLAISIASGSGATAAIDASMAERWAAQLRDASDRLDLGAPTLSDLLPLPGVVVESALGVDPERDEPLVLEALESALGALDVIRRREGEHLSVDLAERVAAIRAGVARIEEVAAELPARVRDALRARIGEILAEVGVEVDESRIVQEAAYQAERADINEELVRLRSHLDKVERLLESDEPVGRTLEFLAQEIHREINTIGSKTRDLQVADTTLELKAELERIREQVQNVE